MSRALMTDGEREAIRGEKSDQWRRTARSRVRERLKRLSEDLEILEEHEPQLYHEIAEVVCRGILNELIQAEIQNRYDQVLEQREYYKHSN